MKKVTKKVNKKVEFESEFKKLKKIKLPDFTGTRVMMMPIILGDSKSIPPELEAYKDFLEELFKFCKKHKGKVGYLTIDEKVVKKAKTHRRKGKHVDGVYEPKKKKKEVDLNNFGIGGWSSSRGGWGSVGLGMLTVASHEGCKAYNQKFKGAPYGEGDCDHLADQCKEETSEVFEAGRVYWVDGLCVHESLPMTKDTKRQFIRLSMPSTAPWFEGYTENSLGIAPTGKILSRRKYMDIA